MNILAVETSTLTGSVALLRDEEVLGEITLSVSVQHSERLMPAIDRLLRDAGTDSSSIDLFAVSKGPGSFTGLRIGMAAIQGLSLAHGKPMVGASTLEALAMNGLFFPGLIVPVLNAYRGEVYRGLYRHEENSKNLRPLAEEKVLGIEELIDELKNRAGDSHPSILLLGNGVPLCGHKSATAVGCDRVTLGPSILNYPRASCIAQIVLQKWRAGLQEETVLPQYLRRPG